MMLTWVLLGAVLLGVLVMLEGARQNRKMRAAGEQRGQRPSLVGVGMLELQGHLQPDRRVEIVLEETKGTERVEGAYRPGDSGDSRPDPDV